MRLLSPWPLEVRGPLKVSPILSGVLFYFVPPIANNRKSLVRDLGVEFAFFLNRWKNRPCASKERDARSASQGITLSHAAGTVPASALQ